MDDFYSDSGALFAKLFSGDTDYPLPEFVKTAEYPEGDGALDEFAETAFADQAKRAFPIYDMAAVFVSAAYANMQDAPDEIKTAIQKAAGLFGIEDEIMRLESHLANIKRARQKSASAGLGDWQICLPVDGRVFTSTGSGMGDLAKTAERFCGDETRLEPLPFKMAVAQEIIQTAGDEKFDLPDEIFKVAGYAYPDTDAMQAHVAARLVGLPMDQRPAFVNKVAQLRDAEGGPEDLQKLAEFVDRWDEQFNLRRFYGSKFPDAARTVYAIPVHKAAEMLKTVQVGEVEHPVHNFDTEPYLKAASYVCGGTDFAKAGADRTTVIEAIRAVEGGPLAFNQILAAG